MIAVIGSNMIDLTTYTDFLPKKGETLEAKKFIIGCGGKGANQAIAASQTGSSVMMVSKVGDDSFASKTIDNFKSYNIDTKYVTRQENCSSGVAPIFVDSDSQNRILIVKGANDYLSPEDIDAASNDLKKAEMIILQLEIPLSTTYYAIDFANQNNIPVLLNPAPADKKFDLSFMRKCEFFVVNETELEILACHPVCSEKEIINAGHLLIEKGANNLIITMGENGTLWLKDKEVIKIEAKQVNAVDTSGAGDAFIGAFSSTFVKSKDIKKSLEEASKYASCTVTDLGTQISYPNYSKFKQMCENFGM